MAIGWMYKGFCHAVQQDAIDNYFQNQPINILAGNGASSVYTAYIRAANGTWNTVKQTLSNAGVVTTNYSVSAGVPVFGSCAVVDGGLYNYVDATAMWAFAFITVLMHWFLAKKVGIVLNAIRRL